MRQEANLDIIITIFVLLYYSSQGKEPQISLGSRCCLNSFSGLPHGTEIPDLMGWVITLNATYIQILEAPPGTGLWEDKG